MINSFFGWTDTPFRREISTKDLYPSEQHQELQARLKFMVQDRSFGLITGEVGVGKSAAIRALRDHLKSSQQYLFLYLSDSSLKPRDFQREMLLQVGVEPNFLAIDLKRQFKTALLDLFENHKKTPVVVIEEGHLLYPSMRRRFVF